MRTFTIANGATCQVLQRWAPVRTHTRTVVVRLWNRSALAAIFLLSLNCALPCLGQNAVNFQYFHDDLGQLSKVVDSAGNVVSYAYDPAGNLVATTRSTLPSPNALSVFNFTPQRGAAGTTVTIQGQGFDTTAGNNTVKFNGKTAAVTSATASSLVVAVPSGATTGPLSVTVGGITAQGGVFTVLPLLTSIAIAPSNPTIPLGPPGFTVQFTAAGTFDDGSSQDLTTSVTWTSSNLAVASVHNAFGSQGLAQILAPGSTTITATSGTVIGNSTVTVTPPALASITITPANPSIPVGLTVQLKATGNISDGTTMDLTTTATWSSSDTNIATISNVSGTQGLASTLQAGSTTITAASGSITGSTNLTALSGQTGAVPRFAYILGATELSLYTMNTVTGQLRPRGWQMGGFSASFGLTVDPHNKFLYAGLTSAVGQIPLIQAYSLNSSSGALSPVPGSPFATGVAAPGTVLDLVVDPSNRFLFAVHQSPPFVSAYTINPTTGALNTVAGSPFITGFNPAAEVIDPSGKFLYVENFGDATIWAYAIDNATGSLTSIPGSPFPNGGDSLAIDPFGKFLYATASSNQMHIAAFSINPNTGSLTQVSGSPFVAGTFGFNFNSRGAAVDPSGKFLYVGDENSQGVLGFVVNPVSGSLTQLAGSPFPGGPASTSVIVDPSGKFVYQLNGHFPTGTGLNSSVYPFALDPTSGALTPLGPARATIDPTSVVMTRGNTPVTYTPRFAYVVNSSANNLSGYTIDATTGALAPLASSPFPTGTSPVSVATDPSGRFVYAANSVTNDVSAYTVDPTSGALSAVAGSPFAAGNSPSSVAVDATGQFVYVTNKNSNTISGYAIDLASGALTPLNNGPGNPNSPFPTGSGPSWLGMDPLGFLAYASNSVGGTVSPYFVSESNTNSTLGGLQSSGPAIATGTAPSSVVVSSFGNFVYVANSGSNNVSGYTIPPSTPGHAPIAGSPFAAGTGPASAATEPSGKFLYIANKGSNNVSGFRIDANTGVLTPLAGSPFAVGTSPTSINVDISGKFVYVSNSGSNNVSVFTLDPVTGVLTPVTGSPFPAGTTPQSVATSGTIQ